MLAECPQLYKYQMVDGWHAKGASVHLVFGHAAGAALEALFRAIIEEKLDHEAALRRAMRVALEETWKDGKPTLGSYEEVWRCLGTAKFKNAKGNAAKCPFSHKGKLFPAPGPEVCGSCGSPTESMTKWFPTLPGKDRLQLMRLLVWYGEELKNGALKPVSIETPEGQVALVEMPFRIPFMPVEGQQTFICGWFDAVKQFGDEVLVTDYKTTKNALGAHYFAQYAPNMQVDLYDLAASVLLPQKGLAYNGVVIEAIQVMKDGVRFGFRAFRGDQATRSELMTELQYYILSAYQFALRGYWPKNRAHCAMCAFKPVCSATPDARPHVLEGNYERYRWNPLKRVQEPVT